MAVFQMTESCMLEAFSHSCTESQLRLFLQNLRGRGNTRLRTHGHIAVLRAIESNEDAGVVKALLEQSKIQVNLLYEGTTLLHTAVVLRNKEATEALLNRKDLDPNSKNRTQDTPLHLAALPCASPCQELVDILEMLVNDSRVHVGALNGDNQTAFHVACKRNLKGVTRSSRRWTSSATAVASIELLLSATERRRRSLSHFLRLQDAFGRTCLHYAAQSGMHEVVLRILEKLGQQSMDASAIVHLQDNKGKVAAHFAAEQGHFAVLKLLLDYGDCKDENGLTTLQYAVRSNRKDIVELCLFQASQTTAQGNMINYINTIDFDKAVSLYLELLRMTTGHAVATFLLEELWKKVTSHNGGQHPTLLHWAVESKSSAPLITHILKWRPKKANAFLDRATETTPLHRAARLQNLDAVTALCSETNWYLNANQRDGSNNTALNYAFESNNKDICRVLMQRQDVKEHLSRLHRYREHYVLAANAILVVAVLIGALAYLRCPTLEQAAEARLARKDKNFRQGDILVVTRAAFLLAMASTILGAFAALPFSFGFFFTHTVDDQYVGKSVKRTRILIVLASYFLVMSLAAVVFSYICSQYLAPYLEFSNCELACEIVFFLFLAVSALFLAINIFRCCNSRRRRAKSPTGWRPLISV